ncbi:MAG TPA: lysine--tRNA ligase [Candidatus Eisenbergiella pullistercoris]|uniref:Lysine--tRNA ligase n=1 Tax=Candidatus Eisenbergiella pullistercoris TaxID=2838555 RepID=A0A9D1YRC5_9FIRM|nr:lysine--tRNA ligase [Candidatus Eisenbergiella pullistercoris]
MHWSDRIAQEIIRRRPDKEEYVCAAGISPSGSIHIGNFRDIATSLFVAQALRRQGKKAKLLFSWDEFDRLRKIPVNVAKVPRPEGEKPWEEYIGCPYVDVPNPFDDGSESYAKYFEKEFEEAMKRFGIEMDYRYQGDMNRSGKYAEHVIHALKKRGEIFDILDSFRTQAAQEGEREAYYPVSIYCPHCGRDTTKITSLSDDCTVAEYECACGHHGTFDFTKDFNCKLAWKIDWPMRWMYEGVDFEPGGKDHASPGGSYDTSRVIAEKIYGYEAPVFQGYEFIGIKGATGKMSGSSGLNLTPDTLLKLYQPEVILWLYAKTEPTRAFDFCFDDGILRQYFEFDKQYKEYMEGKGDDFLNVVMESCLRREGEADGKPVYHKIETVPMSLLVQLGSVVDFNVPMLETVFEKIGQPFTYEQFKDRLDRAKYWLEQCSPENVNRLRVTRNWEVYDSLNEEEKKEIALLHAFLTKGGYDLEGLNQELYAIPKQVLGNLEDAKELKKIQGQFFKNVYKLLIDKEKGPRLYLFLYAIDPERYVHLLDFSTPMTEEEKRYEEEKKAEAQRAAEPEKKQVVFGDPDPVEPVREEISMEDFQRMDMRVCRILKCAEIRKSHSCYKLTLFDGLKERVIVSSIKSYYSPEEMVGKKIIVLANLKPARFSGVTSEGMLLAATNNACGCQVIFVDDIIPEGTRIC